MKHGDISNHVEHMIAFRCEDYLIKPKTTKVGSALLNTVFGKFTSYEVDKKVEGVMYRIYRYTDMTVDLVVEQKNYTGQLKKIINDLPYNRIILITKPVEITQRLMIGDITYYVDDSDERRNLINHKHAVTLEQIKLIL